MLVTSQVAKGMAHDANLGVPQEAKPDKPVKCMDSKQLPQAIGLFHCGNLACDQSMAQNAELGTFPGGNAGQKPVVKV